MNSIALRDTLKRVEFLHSQRVTVVDRSATLPDRNLLEERRPDRCRVVECHVDGILVYADIGMEAARQRRVDQILRRATHADEQVVVVGIDDRGSACEIRKDRDRPFGECEFPRLRVVA